MGIPLVAGRDFTEADAEGAPFIVNEYLARELLPDRDPMGQRLPGAETPVTIVGVPKNSWQTRYHAPVEDELYHSSRQFFFGTFLSTIVRPHIGRPARAARRAPQ